MLNNIKLKYNYEEAMKANMVSLKVLFHYLLQRTDKNHRNLNQDNCLQAQIQMWNLQNITILTTTVHHMTVIQNEHGSV